MLGRERVDVDGRAGVHARAVEDEGRRRRRRDADVDARADAHEAGADAARDRQGREGVECRDVDGPVGARDRAAVVGLGRHGQERHADRYGDADEAGADGDHEAEDVLARGRLDGDTMEGVEAEARVRLGAVGDAGELVAAHCVAVEGRPVADEGLGVLTEQQHRDAGADPDEATGDAAGDAEELRRVAREQRRVVTRHDRRIRACVRIDVVREHDHVHGRRDADRAAAAGDRDRIDRIGLSRRDDDVVRRPDGRRVVDERVGVQVEDSDIDARPDARAAADRERRRGEDLVVLVAGRDDDVRARGRAAVVVDVRVLADRRVRVDRDDVDGARDADAGLAADRGRDADRCERVAVRRAHCDTVDELRARGDRLRAFLRRVGGRRLARLDEAVRAAGRHASGQG